MMKKRILTISLTILFLVSTTGLPIYSHYCEMMGNKSKSECMACKVEAEKIMSSCCSNETSEFPVKISSPNPVCCSDEFAYNKVEDEFIYSKSESNCFSSSEFLFLPITLLPLSVDFSVEESFYNDSSPPFLINPEIHITNSSLLI